MNQERARETGGEPPAGRSPGLGNELLPGVSRRRLFKGAGGGIGVLLTVSAKTALGGAVCQSPSAQMSGNTSPRPGSGTTCSGGLSPGYWKVLQHQSSWPPAGGVFPTFKVPVADCATGTGNLSLSDIATAGTVLGNVFAGAPSVSMWGVIAFPNDPTFGDKGQLLRHLSAAWLNAGYFASSTAKYPLSKTEVVNMWNAVKMGGLYCPASMPNCGTQGWSAAQVQAYIEGLYDINAPTNEPDVCKK